MGFASSARSDLNRWIYLAILVLSVGSAFGLSWLGHMKTSVSLTLLGMGALAWFRYQQCQPKGSQPADGESLEVYADQIYLLGYLLTIAAIVGVVLQTGSGTGNLLKAGAVKLATTIVGLLIMFWFKERAHGWTVELRQQQAEQDSVLNLQLRGAIRGLISEAETLREKFSSVVSAFDPTALSDLAAGANEMARIIRETAGVFPSLKGETEQTAANLKSLQLPLQTVTASAEQLGNHLTRLYTEGAAPLSDTLQALAGRAEFAAQSLGKVAPRASDLEQSLHSLAQRADTDKERLSQTRDAFRRLGDSFEKLDQRLYKISNLYSGDAAVPLGQLLLSLQQSAQKLETLNERLANASAQLSQSAVNRESLAHVGDALKQLTASMDTLKNAFTGNGDENATHKLTDAIGRFEASVVKLEQIASRPASDQTDVGARRWFGFGR